MEANHGSIYLLKVEYYKSVSKKMISSVNRDGAGKQDYWQDKKKLNAEGKNLTDRANTERLGGADYRQEKEKLNSEGNNRSAFTDKKRYNSK